MTRPKPSEFLGGNIKLPAAGATNNPSGLFMRERTFQEAQMSAALLFII